MQTLTCLRSLAGCISTCSYDDLILTSSCRSPVRSHAACAVLYLIQRATTVIFVDSPHPPKLVWE